MLDFILEILPILGTVLLILILLLLAALLLVLFFPVTYRLRGRRTADKTELYAGMNWLFGLLRVRCLYPEPGTLTAKLLWFKLYETKLPPDGKDEPEQAVSGEESGGQKQGGARAEEASGRGGARAEEASGRGEAQAEEASGQGEAQAEEASGQGGAQAEEARAEEASGQEEARAEEASGRDKTGPEESRDEFLEKFHKIKYTICSICDKIKGIWKNISYYTALLQEENTRQSWSYVKLRAVKILRNIRPRRIRADILFGTGSPDTTGYVYGIYCMLYPFSGDKVLVTPDFERAVLEGRLDISGHITVFVLVVNAARLMMDRKLQAFIRKLKKETVGHKKAPQKGGASH